MAISLRPFTLAWLLCLIIADSAADSIHYHYRVVQQYPHSRSVFTQGLEYQNGLLYESAGLTAVPHY